MVLYYKSERTYYNNFIMFINFKKIYKKTEIEDKTKQLQELHPKLQVLIHFLKLY